MKATKYLSCILFLVFQPISAQDFWQQTNGPYDVPTVYDILQYNDSSIFLGTNDGIVRSNDNGETWIRIDGEELNSQIRGITRDYFGTLYAGRYNAEHGYRRLLKSTDEGDTWIQTGFGAEIRYILIPYKDSIMVGTWDKGVYRSFDGGTTWSKVNNGNIYNGIYEIIQLDDGSILAGSAGGGVFKTTNWGDVWVPFNSGLPINSQGYIFAKSFCNTTSGCLLVGTEVGIYCSTNNGETWSFKSTGLTNKGINKIVYGENGIIYAGVDLHNGVYYSNNNGDSWNHLGLNITTYTLGWDSDARLYAGGLSSGLFQFVQGDSSWNRVIAQGYNTVEVNKLWITDSGNLLAGTQGWGLHYTTNSGELWQKINDPTGFYAIETIQDSIFIGAGFENIYVSHDAGKTWTSTGNISFSTLFYEPTSQVIYAGSYPNLTTPFGIYTSSDFGQTWQLIHTFQIYTSNQWINPILVTKTNQVILANVVYSSQFGQYFKIFRSTDSGQTWDIIHSDNGYFPKQIIEDYSLNLFVLTGINGGKLLVSEDEGESWITRDIPYSNVLASDFSGRIYGGLSYSTDKGVTWIAMPTSGLQDGANAMVISQNNRIYIGNYYGAFRAEADSLVVSVKTNEHLQSFYLYQNYPNPFNPITSIQYVVSSRQIITLKVYDVLGNEIATLLNEEKQPGLYEVEFDGFELPSGIYFYQLKAANFVETKKMVLIK